jgi:hypothetical protein
MKSVVEIGTPELNQEPIVDGEISMESVIVAEVRQK